ncbi:uncharacterized protein DUF4105 [Lutibacter sp. Hel_I_33_5]|nr:uncharacterized protein DUF4105 [Lutibacter sp. Hel_I_33_5]
MKKYLLFFLLISFFGLNAQNLELSEKSEISIITAGPGEELYEKFGHSAIRIKDTSLNIDDIYNYGIFDFKAPNFILNFTKGRLLYKLAKYPFHYFVRSNQKEKRWVKEQVLNLNLEQNQAFFEYLENNAKPENASYYYDPFFDNCATKLRDIITIILKDKVTFDDTYASQKLTIRELMNREIHWNTWGSFGINLALGSKLDKEASASQYMYLPDYVYKALNKGKKTDEDLIKKEHSILNFKEPKTKLEIFNPFSFFSIIALIGIFITFIDVKKNKRSKWFDFILFFITGLIGLLIVFLWFFTNHSTTPNNFNFLWAFAPNLLLGFILLRNQQKIWVKKYVGLLLILLIIIPIVWLFKVQLLPTSIVPLLLLLFYRYMSLYKRLLTFK